MIESYGDKIVILASFVVVVIVLIASTLIAADNSHIMIPSYAKNVRRLHDSGVGSRQIQHRSQWGDL
jgi:hypothetical protein